MNFERWAIANQDGIRSAQGASDRRWFVLKVQPQYEGTAVTILPQLDVVAFVPVEQRTRKQRGKAGFLLRTAPVLSGYVIAGFDHQPHWFPLFRMCRFLVGVVSIEGKPWELSENDLGRLFGIHSAPSLPGAKSLKPGDMIRVTRGGFQGHESQLIDVDGISCEFIVRMLGKSHRVRRPIFEVEAA